MVFDLDSAPTKIDKKANAHHGLSHSRTPLGYIYSFLSPRPRARRHSHRSHVENGPAGRTSGNTQRDLIARMACTREDADGEGGNGGAKRQQEQVDVSHGRSSVCETRGGGLKQIGSRSGVGLVSKAQTCVGANPYKARCKPCSSEMSRGPASWFARNLRGGRVGLDVGHINLVVSKTEAGLCMSRWGGSDVRRDPAPHVSGPQILVEDKSSVSCLVTTRGALTRKEDRMHVISLR